MNERHVKNPEKAGMYLSWEMNKKQEVGDKHKPVEVSRAFFETEKKPSNHFTILEEFCPEHDQRFGTGSTFGFDRGGHTREHAILTKTTGVKLLVVLVNQTDDPTVNWDVVRYRHHRYRNQGTDRRIHLPVVLKASLLPFIDELPSLIRKTDGPFIMSIVNKYKDMGTVLMGKVESGTTRKGINLLVMPNRIKISVDQLYSDDEEVTALGPGENQSENVVT